MQQLLGWLPILLIAVVFWLVLIRPAQRRQSATVTMQKSVDVGDEVVLSSGIFGTVVDITPDHIAVEVSEGVTLRVLRGAIGSKVHQDDPADADAADESDESDESDDTHSTTDDDALVDRED